MEVTFDQALQIAAQHHQAGRLGEAEAVYRQLLQVRPGHAGILARVGVLCYQLGRAAEAAKLLGESVAGAADNPAVWNNYALVLNVLGQHGEAEVACRRALGLRPGYASALNNLGIALQAEGRVEEAVAAFREAAGVTPVAAEICANLGRGLMKLNRAGEAADAFARAAAADPGNAEWWESLGISRTAEGRFGEAMAAWRKVVALNPNSAKALGALGGLLTQQQVYDEAVEMLGRAVAANPKDAASLYNMGEALANLGRHEEAVAWQRRALEAEPGNAAHHSGLLFELLFHPTATPEEMLEEARRFERVHALHLAGVMEPPACVAAEGRRLRVGYLSCDFYLHAQSFFTLPVLAQHNHGGFEICCYSDVVRPDEVTAKVRTHADVWREVRGFSDEQLARQIREDRVDVLVDLTMHMRNNRLLTMARRPAPVQMSWLAYPGTTGLSAIGYRLTDPFLDPRAPSGESQDEVYAEESVRLESFWCYDPMTAEPGVNALPAAGCGHVTFGSLNNFRKYSAHLLEVWAGILREVPGARLILLAASEAQGRMARAVFERNGVSGERVEFVARQSRPGYLALHHRIDCALDPFPCNGHTTTIDAAWMGVPTVTLVGRRGVARGAWSILSQVGLPELAARTEADYVALARALAGDWGRLAELRRTLRARLQASTLMDAPRFTRKLEQSYRDLFARACGARRAATGDAGN